MGDDSRRPDKIFDTYIDLHDRQHFEIAFNYDVSPAAAALDGKVRFRVDAYFFLPTNLGVSALSYGKDDFFNDILSYLRYKTPNLDNQALLDPLNPQSPLNVLSFNLKQLLDQPEPDAALERRSVHEAKLFGCILIANWRDMRKEARQLGRMMGRDWDRLDSMVVRNQFAERMEDEYILLDRLRCMRVAYEVNRGNLTGAALSTLKMVDEYLTYRFDETTAKISRALLTPDDPHDRLGATLRQLGQKEASYRAAQGFVALDSQQSSSLEMYTYRLGALKKHLSEVLFLDVRTVREAHRVRAWVAAAGAGLAAFWSTLGDRNVNIRLHGVSTTALILIIVAVYILKDRIKEFFKETMASQVQRLLPDQRLTITDPMGGEGIGTCRQTVRYDQKSDLPADIRHVRDATHVINLDDDRREEVLAYQHSVSLDARTILARHTRMMHVKHILRFSVATLLRRLSDPFQHVQHFNPRTQAFEDLLAPKVYHVNVVFRVSRRSADGSPAEPVYHRLRVIITKDGIDRIETVDLNKLIHEVGAPHGSSVLSANEAVGIGETEDLSPN